MSSVSANDEERHNQRLHLSAALAGLKPVVAAAYEPQSYTD
jgi:hypothetical protein